MRDYISESEQEPTMQPALRLPSLPQRLEVLERLMSEAILDPVVSGYRQRALFTFFCAAEPDELAGYEGQLESVGRCLDWFVFDYIIPELNATPAQHWFDSQTEQLNAIEWSDIRDCLDFALGLFEIAAVRPGEGFVALDLLRSGACYLVNETVISPEVQAGQLLAGRLFPHRSAYILSGMAAVMEESATQKIEMLVADGHINPDETVERLDGLELENLFGRNLARIESMAGFEAVTEQLERYVTIVHPGHMSMRQLIKLIHDTDDLVTLAAEVCTRFAIQCRHEVQLISALLCGAWSNSNKL